MNTSSHHSHTAETTELRPFFGPVHTETNGSAHGNICEREWCSCGATRDININGIHTETGPWHPSETFVGRVGSGRGYLVSHTRDNVLISAHHAVVDERGIRHERGRISINPSTLPAAALKMLLDDGYRLRDSTPTPPQFLVTR